MINWSIILRFLGFVSLGISACLVPVLTVSIYFGDDTMLPLCASIVISSALGLVAIKWFKEDEPELNHREGTLLVVLAWIIAVFLGSLPYWFSPAFDSFTDAFFESMSGFTTTGATILSDIEGTPTSLLFWRSLSHWIGGMGIIVLGIAILPLVGASGTILYKAEFSGAKSEKLRPRIQETASTLWKVYLFFTILEYLALRIAGMTRLDAICHSFSTMATGGFSTRNLSVESFDSPLIEYIIIVFMLIAGINFALHFRFLERRDLRTFIKSSESMAYLGIIAVSTAAITITIICHANHPFEESFRMSAFQVVSIMTCTGFCSANFETWAPFAKLLLLILMFVGGCAGSTSGGLKVSRIILLRQVIVREFQRIGEKRGVFAVWKDGKVIPESTVSSLLNLVYLVFIVHFFVSLVLVATGVDIITAVSAVTSCMFNVGPGLNEVGAYDNYSHLHTIAKWALSFDMLAGRLELYTFLVIFSRSFWRK